LIAATKEVKRREINSMPVTNTIAGRLHARFDFFKML
jgi:hypothetical protein